MVTEADRRALLSTILGEARGEGYKGMAGVARVVKNRSDARGRTPSQVVSRKSQFDGYGYRPRSGDPIDDANRAIDAVFLQGEDPARVGNADHFAANYIDNHWTRAYAPTANRVGGHTFYSSPGAPKAPDPLDSLSTTPTPRPEPAIRPQLASAEPGAPTIPAPVPQEASAMRYPSRPNPGVSSMVGQTRANMGAGAADLPSDYAMAQLSSRYAMPQTPMGIPPGATAMNQGGQVQKAGQPGQVPGGGTLRISGLPNQPDYAPQSLRTAAMPSPAGQQMAQNVARAQPTPQPSLVNQPAGGNRPVSGPMISQTSTHSPSAAAYAPQRSQPTQAAFAPVMNQQPSKPVRTPGAPLNDKARLRGGLIGLAGGPVGAGLGMALGPAIGRGINQSRPIGQMVTPGQPFNEALTGRSITMDEAMQMFDEGRGPGVSRGAREAMDRQTSRGRGGLF